MQSVPTHIAARYIRWTFTLLICCLAMAYYPAAGATNSSTNTSPPSKEILSMSLEDLMNIDVTTVSKKAERLDETAAAVCVITQEDIRRSGLTNVADLLRMVPGMQSAHLDANKWAVGARGFAERFEKMLLVLVDGRSVYLPSTSGVYWLAQDLMIENIDRIEVVRGPGATIWGANAVNGVVNIITKKASAADGKLMTATGVSGQNSGAFQVSGQSGTDTDYRLSAQSTNNTGFEDISQLDAADGWNLSSASFRIDRGSHGPSSFTLEGNALRGEFSQTVQEPILTAPYLDVVHGTGHVSEGNLLARWTNDSGGAGGSEYQVFYDRIVQNDKEFSYTIDVADLDFRTHVPSTDRHDIVWGGGARFTNDRSGNTDLTTSTSHLEKNYLLNLFVQDEIKLRNKAKLILGSKLEYNDQTGAEVEPTARILVKPSSNSTAWASASRAVRMPSSLETHTITAAAAFPGEGGLTYLLEAAGNPDLKSETLVAYEAGYRIQPTHRLSFDLCAFRNSYDKLRGGDLGTPYLDDSPVPHMVMPLLIMNNTWGTSTGLELSANYSVTSNWRLALSYSRMHDDFFTRAHDPMSGILSDTRTGYGAPQQFQVRSYVNLRRGLEFDTALYYTSSFVPPLSAMSFMTAGWAAEIPSYLRLDARLGLEIKPGYELSLIGQNLLEGSHLEFGPALNEVATAVPRTIFMKAAYSF